jgi:hypothetical protein
MNESHEHRDTSWRECPIVAHLTTERGNQCSFEQLDVGVMPDEQEEQKLVLQNQEFLCNDKVDSKDVSEKLSYDQSQALADTDPGRLGAAEMRAHSRKPPRHGSSRSHAEWPSQREGLALARSRYASCHPSIVCIDVARKSSWQYELPFSRHHFIISTSFHSLTPCGVLYGANSGVLFTPASSGRMPVIPEDAGVEST